MSARERPALWSLLQRGQRAFEAPRVSVDRVALVPAISPTRRVRPRLVRGDPDGVVGCVGARRRSLSGCSRAGGSSPRTARAHRCRLVSVVQAVELTLAEVASSCRSPAFHRCPPPTSACWSRGLARTDRPTGRLGLSLSSPSRRGCGLALCNAAALALARHCRAMPQAMNALCISASRSPQTALHLCPLNPPSLHQHPISLFFSHSPRSRCRSCRRLATAQQEIAALWCCVRAAIRRVLWPARPAAASRWRRSRAILGGRS